MDGVDQDVRPGVVGLRDQFGDREVGPVVPGQRAQTDEFRVGDGVAVRFAVEPAVRGRDDPYLASLSLQPLPGQDARGVFEVGPDDGVSGFPLDPAGDPGDAVGGALGQCDLPGVGSEEVGDVRPHILVESERVRVRPRIARRAPLVGLDLTLGRLDDPSRAGTARARVEVPDVLEHRNGCPDVCWRGHRVSVSAP